MDYPDQNTGVGDLSLFQGIFPTQGSNPDLLHCRCILYELSHQGSSTPILLIVKKEKLVFRWYFIVNILEYIEEINWNPIKCFLCAVYVLTLILFNSHNSPCIMPAVFTSLCPLPFVMISQEPFGSGWLNFLAYSLMSGPHPSESGLCSIQIPLRSRSLSLRCHQVWWLWS